MDMKTKLRGRAIKWLGAILGVMVLAAMVTFGSTSSDQGMTWSAAVAVNIAPANTAIFPWIAARNGTVDLVYYATTGSSKDDSGAVWNVYQAQTMNDEATFAQSLVSNAPNHMGVICTDGIACPQPQIPGTRNLLDLFKVAIDPQNGKAAVIYTDDDSLGSPLLPLFLHSSNRTASLLAGGVHEVQSPS
jgi:hypothetical protein